MTSTRASSESPSANNEFKHLEVGLGLYSANIIIVDVAAAVDVSDVSDSRFLSIIMRGIDHKLCRITSITRGEF